MGKASRDKGARFEREIAKGLRDSGLDPEAKRNMTESQQSGLDIVTSLPLGIQCKNQKTWSCSPHEALRQAIAASGPNRIPVAAVRITGKPCDLAILRWEEFLGLFSLALTQLKQIEKEAVDEARIQKPFHQ